MNKITGLELNTNKHFLTFLKCKMANFNSKYDKYGYSSDQNNIKKYNNLGYYTIVILKKIQSNHYNE